MPRGVGGDRCLKGLGANRNDSPWRSSRGYRLLTGPERLLALLVLLLAGQSGLLTAGGTLTV